MYFIFELFWFESKSVNGFTQFDLRRAFQSWKWINKHIERNNESISWTESKLTMAEKEERERDLLPEVLIFLQKWIHSSAGGKRLDRAE